MGLITQIIGTVKGWGSPLLPYSPLPLAPAAVPRVAPLSSVLLATTNYDPQILASIYSLSPNPSPILAGTLAWCHQRRFLGEATEALRDFGVPLEHLRIPIQDLNLEKFSSRDPATAWERMRRFMTLANEIGIPRHHWRRAYSNFGAPYASDSWLQGLFDFKSGLGALERASLLGLGRQHLVQGAKIILKEGSVERVAKILAGHLERPEGSLKGKLYPLPDEENPFGLAGEEIKKIGPKGLLLFSKTDIPPSEWFNIICELHRQRMSPSRYTASLRKWGDAGFHWKEHFFFYVLLGFRNRDLDSSSLKRLKGKFGIQATTLLTLEKLARQVLQWHEEHPKVTWPNAIKNVFRILEEDIKARYTVYLSFGGLTVVGYSEQDHSHPEKQIFRFNFSVPPKPIFDFADYFSRAEVWLVGGILYLESIQCNNREYRDWESITLAAVEEWGRQNGVIQVVMNTPYAILGQAGTLAIASIRNLLDVYFYFPQSHGFTLQEREPPEKPVMFSHNNYGAPSRYFWTKTIG